MITTKTFLITAMLITTTAVPLHVTDAQRPVELPPPPAVVYQIPAPKAVIPEASVVAIPREPIAKDEPIVKYEPVLNEGVNKEANKEMKKEAPEPEIIIVNKTVSINKNKTFAQCRDAAFESLYERVNIDLARSTRMGPTDVDIIVEL